MIDNEEKDSIDNSSQLSSLLEFITSDDKVCPNRWEDLRKLMEREASIRNISEKVPVPLILGGWWASNAGGKRERVIEQVKYSEKHGFLDKVDTFLRSLPVDDWYKCPEEELHRPSVMDLNAEKYDRRLAVILEGKKYYDELKCVEDEEVYHDFSFARHMWNFHVIHSHNSLSRKERIETLQEQINEYEEGLIYSEDHEVDFWKKKMASNKAELIKLNIFELVETHEKIVGSDIMDFFQDIEIY
jgi:hypothetical protein